MKTIKNNHGGARPGAGRPPIGKESAKEKIEVRVASSQKERFRELGGADWLRETLGSHLSNSERPIESDVRSKGILVSLEAVSMPQFSSGVRCGFPMPTFDYAVPEVDLAKELIRHPGSAFMVEAVGDSMIDAGIASGDRLICDRALTPKSGDVVIASINGEFTVKSFYKTRSGVKLQAQNHAADYPTICPAEFDDFRIVGVVLHCIKAFR